VLRTLFAVITAVPRSKCNRDKATFGELNILIRCGGRKRADHQHFPGTVDVARLCSKSTSSGIAFLDFLEPLLLRRLMVSAASLVPLFQCQIFTDLPHRPYRNKAFAFLSDHDWQLHCNTVFRNRCIGKFLRIAIAGNALGAVIPFQQHRDVLVVVHRTHCDGVVGRPEKAFLANDLRYR